jgi:hypothetical protein
MLEGAEKPKTGGQISPPLGYACWRQQMQTNLGVDPAGNGFGPKISYARLIRGIS